MSGSHEPGHHASADEHGPQFTRREALQAGGAIALGAVVVTRPGAAGRASASTTALADTDPFVAAMHVHASYSEGHLGITGSWEQQYANAAAAGADVLFQTDHDFRARAQRYMGLLSGTFTGAVTGNVARHDASFSESGPIHVMVEAAGSTPATQSLVMADKPTAVNSFRTGIDGQTLTHVFGASRLDDGARYEMVLALSLHPAQAGRPAGVYSLRYRFEPGAPAGRFTEGRGLVGVVRGPMPPDGTTVTLDPQADIAALWPDMLAIDHCSTLLTFTVTSPRSGVVADVRLRSVTVHRARHDAAGVLAAQRAIRDRFSGRVTGFASEEVSMGPEPPAHVNSFGYTPEYALKTVTPNDWEGYYRAYIGRVHAAGGAVSWNHPFGSSEDPLLSSAEQTALRRRVYAQRRNDVFLGADVLEVGYRVRGHMPLQQHLNLWDTFSRHGRFLTGNGASDDHSGQDWRGLTNGFLTGIWAASSAGSALAAALKAGRAYAFHPGQVQGLHLDMLVDGSVPMGKVAVRSTGTSRSVAISLGNLPSGCSLELLRSPVDYSGQDLMTTSPLRRSVPAGTTTVTTSVSTSTSCFIRPQLYRNGILVATGNPIWLLREPPPTGVPGPRQP